MNLRIGALTLGATLGLTLPGPLSAAPASPRATPAPPSIVAGRPPADSDALFSPHARRLVRAYLRLRLLELREDDLDRVRAVIEGRLRVDDLVPVPPARPVVR